MPLIYWHPSDEDQVVGQPQTTFFTDNAEWWVEIFQNGQVAYALQAVLESYQLLQAESIVDLWQDDPAGSLTATVDEYFWQNPTPPVPGTLGPLYLPDPEEIPVANLTATVDEYFWQNPTAPVVGTLYQYLPLGVDEQTPTLFGQFDEDFWQNPVPLPPVVLGPLYLPDPEEIPAADLTATVDEYFWQNPTPPVVGYLYQVLPLGVDEQTPVLFGQFDEDFWVNPAVVCYTPNVWPQQASFETQDIVSVAGQPDEDFWQNPTPPIVGYLLYPQQGSFDEQFPVLVAPSGVVDEDFWLGGMISVPACYTVNALPAQWDSDPSELLVVPPLILLDFPDTILLDMASDPTYPLSFQINAINTLLSRREFGRIFPAYVPIEQQVLRRNSIQALLDLRSAKDSVFAALLAQQEILFVQYGY